MSLLDALFLVVFWSWAASAVLFLLQTAVPKIPPGDPPDMDNASVEAVRFQATDGLWLSGWKISVDPTRPWIIACHGLGVNRADLMDVIRALVRSRYNLLLFDFRGHGVSQGRWSSFGWQEQRDLEGALAFLGQQPDVAERPYGVYGVSMGGAVALLVAARDERIGAVAVDGVYPDLEDSLAHHLRLLYHLPAVPFLWYLNLTYRLRFGVWPKTVAPGQAVGKISPRAFLLISTTNDQRIPAAESETLFQSAQAPKEHWRIPSADHLEGFAKDPEVYRKKLAGFFDSYLTDS